MILVATGDATGSGVTRLAVACDDGCLRLFQIHETENGAQYFRSFPKVIRLLSHNSE